MKRLMPCLTIVGNLVLLAVSGLLLPAEDAQAIPAFARKYSMSCTTCHAPAPRLKAYGDDFAGNGFVLADQDAPRYTQKTGDDNLALIRDLPLAIRLEGYWKHQTESKKELDFTFPYNIKLLSGGVVANNISYYFYFFFSERGEVAGLEDAFVMFNNIGGSELDAYVGQFQVSDPLFKRELRLTYEDYQVYRYRPGESNIDLRYDRGLMLTYGFESGTDVILELISGSGIGAADDNRTYDSDKYKCGAARLSQDVSENLRFGVFGYYGKEGASALYNEVTMLGADATLSGGPLDLNFQYMRRKDTDPDLFGSGTNLELETNGDAIMAELTWWPHEDQSRWYAVGLYNWVDWDRGDPLYHSVTGHVGHLLATNVRLFVEDTYHIEDEENRFLIGLMTAF